MDRQGTLVVAGTGIQWAGQTTLAARRAIERADRVLFAVADPLAARWLRSLNPSAEPLPYPSGHGARRRIYRDMVERILAELREQRRVCAVFYGHPGVLVDPGHECIRRARAEGFPARMLPGVSSLDCLYADLGVDPGSEGCQVYDATDFLIRRRTFDVRTPLVLCQVGFIGNPGVFDAVDPVRIRRGLEVLREALGRSLPGTHEVVLYEASMSPLEPARMERVRLEALADVAASDVSSLYVPPLEAAAVDTALLERLELTGRRKPAVEGLR